MRRIYGGAFLIPKTVPDPVIEEETQRKKDIEIRITEAIGKLAATMVEEGDMVYLGNGLQTLEVAKNLVKIPNLTYITGSMMIANFLMNSNCMTYILGGLIDPYEQNIYTRSAMSMMGNFTPTRLFWDATELISNMVLLLTIFRERNWEPFLFKVQPKRSLLRRAGNSERMHGIRSVTFPMCMQSLLTIICRLNTVNRSEKPVYRFISRKLRKRRCLRLKIFQKTKLRISQLNALHS